LGLGFRQWWNAAPTGGASLTREIFIHFWPRPISCRHDSYKTPPQPSKDCTSRCAWLPKTAKPPHLRHQLRGASCLLDPAIRTEPGSPIFSHYGAHHDKKGPLDVAAPTQ